MQTIDITPTPEACRQIALLFRAQQAHSEALIARATRALDALGPYADTATSTEEHEEGADDAAHA